MRAYKARTCTQGDNAMPEPIPTQDEVLGYFDSLSNWGRWGDDDQLGTLNLLSTDKTQRAASLVQDGEVVSCARTITFEYAPDTPRPPLHYMLESGEGWATGQKVTNRPSQAATDFIGMVFHGWAITHVDALSHFFWQGKMYNNQPAHLVSTSLGATSESIELAASGVVTRGVLVDVPLVRGVEWLERGEGVMPSDILAAEEQCGFKVEEGDVLLVRTGQHRRRAIEGPVNVEVAGTTACQAACLPLFHERGIAMLGSDTSNDVRPSHYERVVQPIHQVGIVAMGMWLIDNADLEGLAEACARRDRWEFMLSVAPLKLSNTTGSPTNPLAIF